MYVLFIFSVKCKAVSLGKWSIFSWNSIRFVPKLRMSLDLGAPWEGWFKRWGK